MCNVTQIYSTYILLKTFLIFYNSLFFTAVETLHKDGKVTWPLDDANAELGELKRTYSSDHDQNQIYRAFILEFGNIKLGGFLLNI